MDMQIPVMDGYSATRFIRAWESQNELEPVRIIALTAHAFNEEVERMLASGCDMHISKPVHKASLLEVIEAFAIESGGDSLPGATRSELGEKAAGATQESGSVLVDSRDRADGPGRFGGKGEGPERRCQRVLREDREQG
jgi:CheY-like chemotaxis protein